MKFLTTTFRISAVVLLTVGSISRSAAQTARVQEISADEFARAYAQRSKYQAKVDTLTFPPIREKVRQSTREKLSALEASDTAPYYLLKSTDPEFAIGPVLKFPSRVVGVIMSCAFEECECWFFREYNGRFLAKTVTGGVEERCVSKEGYLMAWRGHGYDANVDISIYHLKEDGVQLVAEFPDVPINGWDCVCWGADRTLYIGGEHNEFANKNLKLSF